MTELRESQRLLLGAIIGAVFGVIFGGITAIGAAHGDKAIGSGMPPALVFLLSFLGWLLSAVVITKLWKYADDERSANWVGVISVVPMVLTSLAVASPHSEFLSIGTLIAFVIGDVIGGIIVGEAAWIHFGTGSSESDSFATPRNIERTGARKAQRRPSTSLLLFLAIFVLVALVAIVWH